MHKNIKIIRVNEYGLLGYGANWWRRCDSVDHRITSDGVFRCGVLGPAGKPSRTQTGSLLLD